MKIAICDDEVTAQNEIQRYITEYSDKHRLPLPEISLFSSGEELLTYDETFDNCFLDVEMSGISGIYTGKALAERNKKIINFIITSHEDYLDEAMHFHAFRFLTKPLDKQRFIRNYKDALSAYYSSIEKIAIETKEGVYTVNTSDIILIEAKLKKVFVTTTQNTYQSIQKMDFWLNSLNAATFFQTHRSFIVNMAYVDNFTQNLVSLNQNNITAYLTVRKYTEFKKKYMMYLECMR